MKIGKLFKLGIIDDSKAFKPFAFAQSCSYDLTTNFVPVSSPLTGGVECVRPKRSSWVMQHEGLLGRTDIRYAYGDKQYTFMALLTYLWKKRLPLTAQWTESTPDGQTAHDTQVKQGTCYIKSLKQVANEKALSKVSMSLQGTGELQDLSLDDLTGAFAYCINGTTLSLYAFDRPIGDFSVVTSAVGEESVAGTWSVAGGRLQTFTVPASTTGVRAAISKDGELIPQPGIAFSRASELGFVLVQTTRQNEQQQTVRSVAAFWWGGVAMGDLTITKGTGQQAQSFTLATEGKMGQEGVGRDNVPFDILGDDITVTLAGPQTIGSVDRTTSRNRIIEVFQTANNHIDWPASDYVTMVRLTLGDGTPAPFACYGNVWGNNANGVQISGTRIVPGTTSYTDPAEGLAPDVQHIHFNIDEQGNDIGGPYIIERRLITDTDTHVVWYAYDATAQRLRIFCPDQVADAVLLANGTVMLHEGKLYDLDSEGNRVPLTINNVAAFSSLVTPYGTYSFRDISAMQVFNLSNTITTSVLALDDIIFTGDGGAEVGRLKAMTPAGAYPTYEIVTVPGTVITGAHMADGAAQSLSYDAYFQTVIVKTTATYNATAGTWSVTAQLRGNSDGSGGAAVLPARLDLRWSMNAAVSIAAGQSSVTASGLAYNPAWITPSANLISADADNFNILTAQTPDITSDHWTAYKLGLVNGYYCYDIAYLGGTHPELALTSGNFMFTPTVIKSGEQVADTLYRLTTSSEDNVSVAVRASGASDWSAATIEHMDVNDTDKLVLSYQLRDNSAGVTVTDLTNIDTMQSVPVYSRKSNIASVLPRLGVVWRSTTVVYADKSLEPLTPGKVAGDEFRVEALAGVYSGDDSSSDIRARFTDNQNNVINVGTDLTGVEVRAVNHGAVLQFL